MPAPSTTASAQVSEEPLASQAGAPGRRWLPRRVVFTPAAWDEPFGQQIAARVRSLGLPVEQLTRNRLDGLRGDDVRETYRLAKSTLAVVTAPESAFQLSPIPPSADWQFHLAEGCPAHCQYCYLAGSLSGPPVIRVYANLPRILDNLARYEEAGAGAAGRPTSFEVSCYTDPLGIEHLTGSLAECVRHFGTRADATLRWVSKFAAVDSLLGLAHGKRTRCRVSVNADPVSRGLEAGTAPVSARLAAARRLGEQGGYPIGLVIAPIMPLDDWPDHYGRLLDEAAERLDFPGRDLTFELISHRFTPGSKLTLRDWYPNSRLEMDEEQRVAKRNKFGGIKYVYPRETMTALRTWFEREIARRFPDGRILYWT